MATSRDWIVTRPPRRVLAGADAGVSDDDARSRDQLAAAAAAAAAGGAVNSATADMPSHPYLQEYIKPSIHNPSIHQPSFSVPA